MQAAVAKAAVTQHNVSSLVLFPGHEIQPLWRLPLRLIPTQKLPILASGCSAAAWKIIIMSS